MSKLRVLKHGHSMGNPSIALAKSSISARPVTNTRTLMRSLLLLGLFSILGTSHAFSHGLSESHSGTKQALNTVISSDAASHIETNTNPLRLTVPNLSVPITPAFEQKAANNAAFIPIPNSNVAIVGGNIVPFDASLSANTVNSLVYFEQTASLQNSEISNPPTKLASLSAISNQEEDVRPATGTPQAPSIKGEAKDAIAEAIANNIATENINAENIDQSQENALATTSQSLEETSIEEISTQASATVSNVNALPTNAIPPYTERLDNAKTEAIVDAPQAASWIIFILVLLFFALLVAWLIRRMLINSHAVKEAAESDLFQTTQQDIYSFDDEPTINEHGDQINSYHDKPVPDFDENIHQTLNDMDDNNEETHEEESLPKSGFMSRLFSGRKNKSREEDSFDHTEANDIDFKNDDETIIDVEVEPLPTPNTDTSLDTGVTNDHDEALERAFMARTPDEVMQDDSEQDDHEELVNGHTGVAAMSTNPYKSPDLEPGYVETLRSLETGQQQTNASVAELAEKFVLQSENMQTELDNIKHETTQHQSAMDKKIETKFIDISNNVSTNLARTQRLTEDKLNQVNNMSTDDIELKIKNLDNRFENQNRIMDNNFTKVMQKLDSLSTPPPQLNRLTSDTSELKKQISALESLTKEQPKAQAFVAAPQPDLRNNEIMNKLEATLNQQQETLAAWRDDNVQLSRNFTALTSRIDTIESDLKTQNSALIQVMEQQQEQSREQANKQAQKHNRADALGLLSTAPIADTTTTRAEEARSEETWKVEPDYVEPQPKMQQESYPDDHYDDNRVFDGTLNRDEVHQPKAEPKKRKITPITFSPESIKPRTPEPMIEPLPEETSPPSAVPADTRNDFQDTTEEKTIRPLTFNFTSDDKGFINR